MKISNIKIFDYQQFKNFELDLTYPKDHPKEGQPLDKICLIGQSGTGKTTILRILREMMLSQNIELNTIQEIYEQHTYDIKVESNFKEIVYFKTKRNKWSSQPYAGKYKSQNQELKFIYFPAEYIDKVHEILSVRNGNNYSISLQKIEADIAKEEGITYKKKKNYFDFKSDNVIEIWSEVLTEIEAYRLQRLNFAQDLVESTNQNDLLKKIEKWQKDNENPLKDLAKILNPILNKFYLEIDTQPNFKSLEELKYIQIKSIHGKEIPRNVWSTGTKQIADTAIPLYKLNTNNTIVLFDEPERSLYPDLQRMIIPYYTETLAPDAQFFFATHSPIIASCFEPWEIVELEFDENGYVQRKQYYEGENHVDNYTIDPRYLRWDSILKILFDVEGDGNSEHRIPKLMELATLKKQIKALDNDNPEKEKLWTKYKKLAELLDWK